MTETLDGVRGDLRFLSNVSAMLRSSLTPALIATRLAEASITAFCDVCAIHIIEEDGELHLAALGDRREGSLQAQHGFETALALPNGPLQEAVRSGQPQFFVLKKSGYGALAEQTAARLLQATTARSLIVVPLWIGAARVGVVSFIEATRPTPFDARSIEVAVAVGSQFSMALENVRLRDREQRITDRGRFMARATDKLFSTRERTALLKMVLTAVVEEIADCAAVVTSDEDELVIETMARAPAGPEALTFSSEVRAELLAALAAPRPLMINQIASSPVPARAPDLREPAHAWLMVPLGAADRGYGAIVCYSAGRTYEESDLELLSDLCSRAVLALDNAESFSRERRLSQALQRATLPTHLADIPGAYLNAVYLPGSREEQVGGDWYDAFPIDQHRILITIGDVTGHGLDASVVMGKLRHSLNVVALFEHDPARILDVVERVVLQRFPDTVATAFVGILDATSNTLTFANAGHPPPLIRTRDGAVLELQAGGLPIGLRRMEAGEGSRARRLDDVELLAFYTDGLTEVAHDPIAGERRLIDTLACDEIILSNRPAKYIQDACIGGEAADDVAVLVVDFSDVNRWSLDSNTNGVGQMVRRQVVARLLERTGASPVLADVELMLGELVANVVRHSPGGLDVLLDWRHERPIVHVLDRGKPFSRKRQANPERYSESGRGLWLLERLGGEVAIAHLPHLGNCVSVTLPIVSDRRYYAPAISR